MRVAGKKLPVNRRHRGAPVTPRSLVSASYEVVDGTHVVTIPLFTENFSNGPAGNSKWFSIRRAKQKKTQRAVVGLYLRLFSVPVGFRGVRMTRLAPSDGLDTGGLWVALKAPQDEVAKHLGINDGPKSPATWEMAQERNKAYGVRVELRMERADAK